MPRRHDPRDARRGAAGHERRSPAVANVTYGIHSVRVLLQRSPQRVRQVWLSSSREAAARLQELRLLALQAQVAVVDADDAQLDQLADGERHQGVIVELVPRARRKRAPHPRPRPTRSAPFRSNPAALTQSQQEQPLPPAGAALKNGIWHYRPAEHSQKSVLLTHSPYAAGYEFCIESRCQALADLLPGIGEHATIELSVCPDTVK